MCESNTRIIRGENKHTLTDSTHTWEQRLFVENRRTNYTPARQVLVYKVIAVCCSRYFGISCHFTSVVTFTGHSYGQNLWVPLGLWTGSRGRNLRRNPLNQLPLISSAVGNCFVSIIYMRNSTRTQISAYTITLLYVTTGSSLKIILIMFWGKVQIMTVSIAINIAHKQYQSSHTNITTINSLYTDINTINPLYTNIHTINPLYTSINTINPLYTNINIITHL